MTLFFNDKSRVSQWKRAVLLLVLIFCPGQQILYAQAAHELDAVLDAALLGSGGIAITLGFHFTGKTEPMTKEELELLDPLTINPFDRPTTKNWNTKAGKVSDITLRTCFVSPFSLLFDPHSRDEAGTIGIMMVETALINNGITNILKGTANRRRPFTYNPAAPASLKVTKNARHSFFSGHASNSASFAFLTAKTFSDNNPGSDWNPYVWSAAVVIPAVTSLLRIKAGKHFPTDVIVGYTVGAAIGLLIPELHKK